MWAWENWWDIVSDLSAIHRLDRPDTLPPQLVIDFAVRLPAYGGIVAARARAEQDENQPMSLGSEEMDGMRSIDSSTANLAADPVFSDLFEVG